MLKTTIFKYIIIFSRNVFTWSWCGSQHFDCLLLIISRWWCQLAMCPIIKHQVLVIGWFATAICNWWFSPLRFWLWLAIWVNNFFTTNIRCSIIPNNLFKTKWVTFFQQYCSTNPWIWSTISNNYGIPSKLRTDKSQKGKMNYLPNIVSISPKQVNELSTHRSTSFAISSYHSWLSRRSLKIK